VAFPNDLGIRMAHASQTWHLMLWDMIRGVLDRDARTVDDLGVGLVNDVSFSRSCPGACPFGHLADNVASGLSAGDQV
jgi:hypothetical protein